MKKEILRLDRFSDCILEVELKPLFRMHDQPVPSKDCVGKEIKHFQQVTGITLLLPTFDKHGQRKGMEVRTIPIEDIKSIAAKIKEIEERPHEDVVYQPEDDLPF